MDSQKPQPSRRKHILRVGAGCAFICVVVVIAWPRGPEEPVYEGKKLSEWLVQDDFGGGDWKKTRTAKALRELGDKSLPCLTKWVSLDRPRWQEWCLEKATRAFGFKAPLVAQMHHKYRLRLASLGAFSVLGPVGKPAIPELKQLAKSDSSASGIAMDCLVYIGCDAAPALIDVLNSGQMGAARRLIELHRDNKCDVAAGVPGMLLADRETKYYATTNYGCFFYCTSGFYDEPVYFFPLVRECLKHSRSDVRLQAAKVLTEFWPDPQTIDGLQDLLRDPVLEVRVEATNDLKKIVVRSQKQTPSAPGAAVR